MNINNNMKGSPMRPIWQTPTPQQPTVAVVTSLAANQAVNSLQVNGGYVAPIYTATGTDISGGTGTTKMVVTTLPVSFTANTAGTLTLTLSGNAVFTSASTWQVYSVLLTTLSTISFTFYLAARSPSSGTQCVIDYIFSITGSSTLKVLAIGS
jgi:hypothetical protein